MNIRNLLLTAILLTGSTGWASDLHIILDSNTLAASPGQQVTFSGVIANNDQAVLDLNNIDVTLDGMFVVDISDFFSGPFTVDASTPSITSMTVDFALFSVSVNVPYTDPLGPITGILNILGGVEGVNGYDPTVQNVLGSTTFSVNVGAPTPEASTFTLMFAAIGLFCFYRRYRGSRWRTCTKHR